jgi:hypothetical protein
MMVVARIVKLIVAKSIDDDELMMMVIDVDGLMITVRML